jgi:hypothetical protein
VINPVIVIGTGRCGSSFVSGVLHNDLDVCMGLEFKEPTKFNPGGYYEDIDIKRNNDDLLNSFLTLQGWAKNIKNIMKARIDRNVPWGFKDPRICDLLGFYLLMFNNPKIICCVRDRDLVIKSLVNKYKLPMDKAVERNDTRIVAQTRLLRGWDYLILDFGSDMVKKEDVIRKITRKWKTFND